jgi:hypothetical protein
MKYADRTVGFLYDHDYKRVQETLTYRDSNVAVRTTYMIHPDNAGGLGYEREISNGKDESRHYISVGGSVIGVVKTLNVSGMLNPDVSSDPNMTHYWHKDSLGSIVAVSNAQGAVLERMAFDAWGRRIKPSGGNDANLDPAHGDRGFTASHCTQVMQPQGCERSEGHQQRRQCRACLARECARPVRHRLCARGNHRAGRSAARPCSAWESAWEWASCSG